MSVDGLVPLDDVCGQSDGGLVYLEDLWSVNCPLGEGVHLEDLRSVNCPLGEGVHLEDLWSVNCPLLDWFLR